MGDDIGSTAVLLRIGLASLSEGGSTGVKLYIFDLNPPLFKNTQTRASSFGPQGSAEGNGDRGVDYSNNGTTDKRETTIIL